ncbi:MAG: hypothetical protein ABFD79_14000 [Phycisphaerales bacterium]
MIHFSCAKCGKSFTATDDYAGKKGRCIKCKSEIFIPAYIDAPPPELQKPKFVNDEQQNVKVFHEKTNQELEPEKFKRKFPWLIDIFCFPLTLSGIILMLVLAFVPLVLMVVAIVMYFIPVIGVFISFISVILIISINLYTYFYLCECIENSAQGYVRLSVNISDHADFSETLFTILRIVACLCVFVLPAVIRLYYSNEADNIFDFLFAFGEYNTPDKGFYILLGISAALFPIALLSIIMHESLWGMNPWIIYKSILHTHIFYIWLVFLFWTFVAAIICVKLFILPKCTGKLLYIAGICVYRFFKIYVFLILAHLLGRFYYKNSHRLNWF